MMDKKLEELKVLTFEKLVSMEQVQREVNV